MVEAHRGVSLCRIHHGGVLSLCDITSSSHVSVLGGSIGYLGRSVLHERLDRRVGNFLLFIIVVIKLALRQVELGVVLGQHARVCLPREFVLVLVDLEDAVVCLLVGLVSSKHVVLFLTLTNANGCTGLGLYLR